MNKKLAQQYWKENLKYLVILLSIWFTVSFGFGILLVDELNQIKIAGFKLGFWFAQQGSIYVFVLLIFVYISLMNRLDKKYNIQLLAKLLAKFKESEESFTCCQHIRFREIIPLCQFLNIKTIYTPHKRMNENSINGIRFIACPLYAVNFEDKDRNREYF